MAFRSHVLRTPRYEVPEPVTGYHLDPAAGFFSAILPLGVDKTNLVANPSAELATTGYVANIGGALTRDTAQQKFGAASIKYVPTAAALDGIFYSTFNTVVGVQYWASVWFKGAAGLKYSLQFATSGGALLGTAARFVAAGFWQPVWVAYSETASTTRALFVLKDSQTNTAPFWIDGLQVEQDQLTTYIDGDQKGFVRGRADYYWTGTPQASTSVRLGQSRAGGKLVSFSDLGFRLLSVIGLGLGGIINQMTPLTRGGAYYGGTVIADRQFTLVGQVDSPGGLQGLARARQAFIDLFKPDVVTPDQPMVLRYQPSDDCGNVLGPEQDIVCVSEGDPLVMRMDNLNSERLGLTFRLYLPFVAQEVGNAGAALGYQTAITNANRIVTRAPNGVWAAMGTGASSGAVRKIIIGNDGIVYAFGSFASMGGVANTAYAAQWNPATGAWTAMGTGGVGGASGAVAAALAPDGKIAAVGDFTSMGGVAQTGGMALWDPVAGTWSSLGTSISGGLAFALGAVYGADGTFYITGGFTNAGGVAAANIAQKTAAGVWSAIGSGLTVGISPTGENILLGPDLSIYVSGSFGAANGTTVNNIAKLTPGTTTFAALGSGTGGTDIIFTMYFDESGRLIVGGLFSSIGGVAAADIAIWNGYAWSPAGAGVPSAAVFSVGPYAPGTQVVGAAARAVATFGNITAPDSVALLNGTSWSYLDIDFPGNATSYTSALAPDGTLYLGFDTAGSANAPGPTTITNAGSAPAGPRYTLVGPGTLYTLRNVTTGKVINFNLTLLAGETAVLDLTDPSNITFVSTFRGNILSTILPGSQLADFTLSAGVNKLSVLIGGTTTAATSVSVQWRITSHSIDSAIPGRLLP